MDDSLNELEKQLKSALAREEAPQWFEARVMNAVKAGTRAQRTHWSVRPWWHWAAGMAIAVCTVGAGVEWQHQEAVERVRQARIEMQQREAGEAAKAQLQLALRVTSAKLVLIQHRLDAQRNDAQRN
jgi:hypothetical protein